MKTTNKILTLLLTCTLLCGCGKKTSAPPPETPLETANCVMESIRELDMETLNRYTDNYVQTWHNWLGIPIENEYRAFNELLQPHSKNSSRYKTSYRLDQKMMEKLTWEIKAVREDGDTAEIDLAITNIDMPKVLEQYETQLLNNMLEAPGTGIAQLIRDTVTVQDTLTQLIDKLDDSDTVTALITVSARQEQGLWRIHMSQDFINAFSGNMYADFDSMEITALEELLDAKTDEWTKCFEEQANQWAEGFEHKAGHWAEDFERKIDSWAGQFE